jgi:PAS domain S-box-containing protein
MMTIIFIISIQKNLVAAGLDPSAIKDISRQFTIIGSGASISCIIIVSLIALFLANRIARPIHELSSGMLDLAAGKWDVRINVRSKDEMGQLARGFNFMAEHIEDMMRKLRTAKDYNNNIVTNVPSILIVLSNRFNILSTSKAFEKLSEQYPELSLDQFVIPIEEDIRRNLESGDTIKKEIEIVPEGSEVKLIFSAVVSRIGDSAAEENKEKASVLLTITNITESRKMKELVLQSTQDWEDTFNMIPDMITIHDRDFNIIMANNAAKKTLDLHLLDFKNSSKCYKYYHGTDSAPPGCPSCNCVKTSEPATFEIFEPHLKKFIEIRSIPRFNNNGELLGLIHIVRDISLRKKIEDEHNKLLVAITKAKMEWEMTFDSAMEFIVLIDKELKITRCNKSFSSYVGGPVEDLVGHCCYEFFPCSSSQVEDCKNCMADSRELLTKSEVETESGRWLYISHRPIKDHNNEYLKSVIIATDVTELKNAQQQIKKSEEELKMKVDDLEQFYNMAIGRELRMKGLKKEIKKLNKKLDDCAKVDVTE